jgi:heat shock protein HslJ
LAFVALVSPASIAALGCSSNSASVASTDTGNRPVIDSRSLRVESSGDGVVVSADPGGVPDGANVEVTNLDSGDSAKTTADSDGSFRVELSGSVDDDYEVEVEVDGKRSKATVAAGSSTPDDPFAALVDRDFELESSTGFTPVEGTNVRIQIRKDSFSFSAGCNSYFGEASFCDGNLCIAGLGSTAIGCDAPLQDQDDWLADFFSSKPAVTPDGDRVTFDSDDASLVFLDSEVADPDRPLSGRVWTIDSFVMGDSVSNLPTAEDPTIEFRDDGSVEVFTVCTSATGDYTVEGDTISLSGLAYPEIACSTMTQGVHDGMLRVMVDGDITYEIDAARLWLTRGEYGLGGTTD